MAPLFTINSADRLPIYAQLERTIRFAIATGQLQAGDQLPTVRQLAVDLRINANTVAKVYAELERTGVVETQRGVGTFVRAHSSQNRAAVTAADRKQQLDELANRFLTEAGSFGYSLDEILSHLESKRNKEIQKNG
jgi:GntR family transcriptional regulator